MTNQLSGRNADVLVWQLCSWFECNREDPRVRVVITRYDLDRPWLVRVAVSGRDPVTVARRWKRADADRIQDELAEYERLHLWRDLERLRELLNGLAADEQATPRSGTCGRARARGVEQVWTAAPVEYIGRSRAK